jgi:hypothetical protein
MSAQAAPPGCAVARSHAESRARTLLALLRRLHLLDAAVAGRPLRLLILGADRNEASSTQHAIETFAPLARELSRLQNAASPEASLHLRLAGPNLAARETVESVFDCRPGCAGVRLTLSFCCATLGGSEAETSLALNFGSHPSEVCHAAVAFNAGLWGYGSWLGAVQALRLQKGCAGFAVTAYCESECDADEEALLEGGHSLLWAAEANAWGSLARWVPTSGGGGEGGEEERRENAWWLCVDTSS